ncbi:GSCOCG00002030001-RA-CDS [Cotesia congregata]|nr:GSCOCG00002030001-RA-CDS [Cotesia congregata]
MISQFIFILLFYNSVNVNFFVFGYNSDYHDIVEKQSNNIQDILGLRNHVLEQDNINTLPYYSNDKTEYQKNNIRNVDNPLKYELDNWTGRWMPDKDSPNTDKNTNIKNLDVPMKSELDNWTDDNTQMGKIPQCDDGKNLLEVDWDGSPINYTCFSRKIIPSNEIHPELYCEKIPKLYSARHACMNESIDYDDKIPMYGTHRPVWPVYGEYKFVPKQRWIHSLEHGAIVMLYHPCANKNQVNLLRKLVTQCLRRHIITPYAELDEARPFALVTWGCRLTMSTISPYIVRNFILTKALHGAETTPKDGEFNEGLMQKAKTVSDENDSKLCPLDSSVVMM